MNVYQLKRLQDSQSKQQGSRAQSLDCVVGQDHIVFNNSDGVQACDFSIVLKTLFDLERSTDPKNVTSEAIGVSEEVLLALHNSLESSYKSINKSMNLCREHSTRTGLQSILEALEIFSELAQLLWEGLATEDPDFEDDLRIADGLMDYGRLLTEPPALAS